jgi:hypothetical protein
MEVCKIKILLIQLQTELITQTGVSDDVPVRSNRNSGGQKFIICVFCMLNMDRQTDKHD